MQIDWENFDKKDLFELRLKGGVPNFGYMSCSKRAKFVQFLVKNDFLSFKGMFQDLVKIANESNPGPNVKADSSYMVLYLVEHSFEYESLSGSGSPYRPTPARIMKGETVVTDKSHRLMNMGTGNP